MKIITGQRAESQEPRAVGSQEEKCCGRKRGSRRRLVGNCVPHSPRAYTVGDSSSKSCFSSCDVNTNLQQEPVSHNSFMLMMLELGLELRERELRLAFGEIESQQNSYQEQDANETSSSAGKGNHGESDCETISLWGSSGI